MGLSWLLRIAQFDPVQERKNSLIFGQCEPGVAKGSRIHSIYNFFVKVKMYLHVLSNIILSHAIWTLDYILCNVELK